MEQALVSAITQHPQHGQGLMPSQHACFMLPICQLLPFKAAPKNLPEAGAPSWRKELACAGWLQAVPSVWQSRQWCAQQDAAFPWCPLPIYSSSFPGQCCSLAQPLKFTPREPENR